MPGILAEPEDQRRVQGQKLTPIQCATGSGPKQRDSRGTCRSSGMEYDEQGVERDGERLARIAQEEHVSA